MPPECRTFSLTSSPPLGPTETRRGSSYLPSDAVLDRAAIAPQAFQTTYTLSSCIESAKGSGCKIKQSTTCSCHLGHHESQTALITLRSMTAITDGPVMVGMYRHPGIRNKAAAMAITKLQDRRRLSPLSRGSAYLPLFLPAIASCMWIMTACKVYRFVMTSLRNMMGNKATHILCICSVTHLEREREREREITHPYSGPTCNWA